MFSTAFYFDVMFPVYTAIKIQDGVFWTVTPCSDVVGYQSFGGPCSLLLHCQTKGTVCRKLTAVLLTG